MQSFTPSDAWRNAAATATANLLRLQTREERLDYIKSNSHVWRNIRAEFIAAFGSRCWFTDAEEIVAPLDIEHFRPKAKSVECNETEYEGYWWLAFELSNLRLAGQIPNRQHKKCYFPLLPGSFRADGNHRRWQEENPVFLDPIRLADVELVAYDETGTMRPSKNAVSQEDRERVRLTDELLGLSAHQPLVEARQRVWLQCTQKMDEVIKLKAEEQQFGGTPRTKGEREILLRSLKKMTESTSPLSSVAASCLLMSGHDWACRLIA